VIAEDETPRLLRALALSQRFHLYLAQCPSPRAADQLIDAIETELPKLRGAPVRVVRLQPYAGRTTDAPLTTELDDRVLIPLLAPPKPLRAHGTIHVVDASRATSSDDDAWARLFASWNEKRNRLQQLQGEVVVVLPRALWLVFATEAPDVWSIRSGEYEIGEPPLPAIGALAGAVIGSVSGPIGTLLGGAVGAMAGSYARALATRAGASSERGEASRSLSAGPVTGTAERPEVAGTQAWRLIPPLSLFGGDVLIAGWLPEMLRFHEVRDISVSPVLDDDAVEDYALAIDPDLSVGARRRLRAAEAALGDRQFARAETLLAGLVDEAAGGDWIQLRIRAVFAVAVAAQDRPAEAWSHAEHVQAAVGLGGRVGSLTRASVLDNAAYAAWCSGHLARAASLDQELADDISRSSVEAHGRMAEAGLLLAMERGSMATAGALAGWLAGSLRARKREARRRGYGDPRILSRGMLAADFAFLGGDIANARRDVEDAVAWSNDPEAIASESILSRARPLAALLAAAQSDLDGAERILRGAASPAAVDDAAPEAVHRQAAFEAYAAGVVAIERGDRSTALAGFQYARQAIARWAQVGFDRRSLWRAHVATLLSACEVDDDPACAAASALEAEQRADTLLGDTGEDHIARVLAVLARRARMRNTTDPALLRTLAHEAVQLIAPLRADGVARWSALADACIRDAEREAR